MGSELKGKVLEKEQIADIIKQWHARTRKKRKKQEQFSQTPRTSLSFIRGNNTNSNRGGEITEENDSTAAAASSSRPSKPVKIELSVLN